MNLIKHTKKTSIFSILLIILSLFFIFTKGFNFNIDFTGGVITEVKFNQDVSTEEITKILKNDYSDISVVHYGGLKNVVIQTKTQEDKNIGEHIVEKLSNNKYKAELVRAEFVGAKVGEELKTDGILALFIVIISVLIYISFRFEYKFAINAVIALVHDIVISAGFISFFDISVDLTVLASILTILGYSLNDTIIVYDRIRENLEINSNSNKRNNISSIINNSIIETMPRTIMTSLTTSISLIFLIFFGGESLFSFAIILLFGIIIGTYSSIFVASGNLLLFNINEKDFKKEKINKEGGVI